MSVARHIWWFAASIVVAPLSPSVGALLAVLFVFITACHIDWRARLAERRTILLMLAVGTSLAWLRLRTDDLVGPVTPGGVGYPITIMDFAPYLIAFLVVALFQFSASELRIVLWALVATVPFYFPLASGQQYLGWTGRVSWGPEWLPIIDINLRPPHFLRLSSGFSNWNGLGCHLLFTSLATVTLLTVEVRENVRLSPWHHFRKALLGFLLLLGLMVMVWTGSRATWLALTAMFIIFSVGLRVRPRYGLVPLLLWWILVLLAAGDFGRTTRGARALLPEVVWSGLRQDTVSFRTGHLMDSTFWRLRFFKCAVELTAERPFLGWGLGNCAPECEGRLRLRPKSMNHAHNAFLQLSSELGLPFAIFLSGLIASPLLLSARRILQKRRENEIILHMGFVLMTLGIVCVSQINLAFAHTHRLESVFWFSLAASYSLAESGAWSPAARESTFSVDSV